MLIVRCTAKLLARLKVNTPAASIASTTALDDWYATILPLRPAHLVLLVNEPTRLPIVLPAREISSLATRIPTAITEVLGELGVAAGILSHERQEMAAVAFDRTASRSVLGTMNEFVFSLRILRETRPELSERALSQNLGDDLVTVPAHGYQHPREFAVKTLLARQR